MRLPYLACTRVIEIDCGHRIYGHEGKCASPHGHRYKIEATAMAKSGLDNIGRVIDFGVIKHHLGFWLEDNWDHGFVVYDKDIELREAMRKLGGKLAVVPFNPTAENMANYLLHKVCPKLFESFDVVITSIRVWETPNCYAEATL